MNFSKSKKYLLNYFKNHYISFIMQSAVLFYIGNLNYAIESKKMISTKGILFGILLIVISLFINIWYFEYKNNTH